MSANKTYESSFIVVSSVFVFPVCGKNAVTVPGSSDSKSQQLIQYQQNPMTAHTSYDLCR